MRIFCELRSIFASPAGAIKSTSNEQNVRSYYMLNHRIRGLLFHYKKNCYLAIGLYFLVRVFRNILPSGRMTLTMSKMFARIMRAKPLNERLIMYCKKKMLFWLLFSSKSIQNILILLAIVAPSPSAGIRPVVNRLNQDTTVYYGLVFCLFS